MIRVDVCHVMASMAVLLACGEREAASPSRPVRSARAEPVGSPCKIADVAGVSITDVDARAIAGLLRPPPPPNQARRLAVAAAIAAAERDRSSVAIEPRAHSIWLRDYRATATSVGGLEDGSGPPTTLSVHVEWAKGRDACIGDSVRHLRRPAG